MAEYGAGIIGVGYSVPERVLTNDELSRIVDTSDEWIVTRTGIRERRIAGSAEHTSVLGARAAAAAVADAGVSAGDLELLICATCTGDYIWPATGCLIQSAIGAVRAAAFDISAACSGFCYGLSLAAALIQSGAMQTVAVVGADTLSRHVDWRDRRTCVLFGDGAGAVVLGRCPDGYGILSSAMGTDGHSVEALYMPYGGTRAPVTADVLAADQANMVMRGGEVFKFAVRIMGQVCVEALAKAGLTPAGVDLFIPHQANKRIIDSAAHRMELTEERVFVNVDRYGNTSAASIPIALAEALATGRVRKGDVLVFTGFGAGLTWGANVVKWCREEPRS